MSRWIITSNIKDFKKKLAAETDPARRHVLEELLASEEKKLRDLEEGERRDG